MLELIGASEEGSESGNSAGPEVERLEVISVSSESENSSDESTDDEVVAEQFEELSNEGKVEASETQGLEETRESGGSDEGSNDVVCPFRSCAWHLPQEWRGVKRKRDESDAD